MNTPIAVRIECAKGEILNAMEAIQTKHALPPCIMDGVLWRGCADYLFPAEWCNFAGYGILD